MKILIAYSSKTGNTKKVGEAISEVIENKDLIDIKENPNPDDYDGVIVGYWADKGKADELSDKFMEKIQNKPCGIFATMGAYPYTDHGKKIINYGIEKLEKNGNKVYKTFICQGKMKKTLKEKFEKYPKGHPHHPNSITIKRHIDASTHPNEKDFDIAKEIFRDFESLIK